MVAEEKSPLRGVRERGRLRQDVDDREAVLHSDRHEEARHQWEVEGHVRLVALAEVGDRVLRPLVGLREQHAIGVVGIDVPAHLFQELVRLREVLAVGALALEQVRDGVEPHAVHAGIEPEIQSFQHPFLDLGVVEVQVGLVRVEAVPVVRAGDVVPGPVRDLEVLEDDPGVRVALVGVAPHVELARRAAGPSPARALKPRVLVRGVVADQLVDDADAAAVRVLDELVCVGEVAVHRVDVGVVGDVVAVVTHRRRVEGKQPDGVDAKLLQVRQLLDQAAKVAAAVAVAVVERAHMHLVDERVLVPERIVVECERLLLATAVVGLDHRKYSKSCSLRRRRRKRNICAGLECGLSST